MRIKNRKVRGLPHVIPHEADQVAVVFIFPVVLGCKRRFRKPLVNACVVGGASVTLQVVTRKAAKPRVFRPGLSRHQQVPRIARLAAEHPRVDDGELLVDDVVNQALFGLPRAQVEAPFVKDVVSIQIRQQFGQLIRRQLAARVFGQAKRRAGHHNLHAALAIVFLPRVGHVVHVGRLGLKPFDLIRFAMARHHAKARRQGVVKLQLVPPRRQRLHVVEQRQVVQDGVVGGDGHVMRQTRPRQLHGDESLQLAKAVQHAIVHVGRFIAIGEKQKLTRSLIDLAVR